MDQWGKLQYDMRDFACVGRTYSAGGPHPRAPKAEKRHPRPRGGYPFRT